MGKSKNIVIAGGVVGIASVLLSLAIPILFSWYHVEFSNGTSSGLYLTAFGTFIEDGISGPDEIVTLVLIGGLMVLAGAGLCIFAGIKEIKLFGIIGGILMILGPTMLIFDLLGEVSEFSESIHGLAVAYDSNVFFGSYTPYPNAIFLWGLFIGTFIPYAAGILGLIGGATL